MCTLPQYFDLLSEEDKSQYLYMRNAFSSSVCKNRRNNSSQTFEQILNTINKYAIRSDGDDWKRCIVCGIFWVDDIKILVNSKQLCTLLTKCKSSINGSLILLHYIKVENNLDQVKSFMNTIPLLQLKPALIELRQWTIRKKILNTDENKAKNVDNISQKDESFSFFGLNDKSLYCDEYLISDDEELNGTLKDFHKGNAHNLNENSKNNDRCLSKSSKKELNLKKLHIDVDMFQIHEDEAGLNSDFVDYSDCYYYQ